MAGTAALQQTLYDEMLSRIAEDDESAALPARHPPVLRPRHQGVAVSGLPAEENAPGQRGGAGRARSERARGRRRRQGVRQRRRHRDLRRRGPRRPTSKTRPASVSTSSHTKNLVSGQTSNLAIARVDGVAFSADGNSLYYVTEDEQTKRADKLFRHVIGDDPSTDALLYEETDEMYILQIERSRSKRFLFVTSASKTTSEVAADRSAGERSAQRGGCSPGGGDAPTSCRILLRPSRRTSVPPHQRHRAATSAW